MSCCWSIKLSRDTFLNASNERRWWEDGNYAIDEYTQRGFFFGRPSWGYGDDSGDHSVLNMRNSFEDIGDAFRQLLRHQDSIPGTHPPTLARQKTGVISHDGNYATDTFMVTKQYRKKGGSLQICIVFLPEAYYSDPPVGDPDATNISKGALLEQYEVVLTSGVPFGNLGTDFPNATSRYTDFLGWKAGNEQSEQPVIFFVNVISDSTSFGYEDGIDNALLFANGGYAVHTRVKTAVLPHKVWDRAVRRVFPIPCFFTKWNPLDGTSPYLEVVSTPPASGTDTSFVRLTPQAPAIIYDSFVGWSNETGYNGLLFDDAIATKYPASGRVFSMQINDEDVDTLANPSIWTSEYIERLLRAGIRPVQSYSAPDGFLEVLG